MADRTVSEQAAIVAQSMARLLAPGGSAAEVAEKAASAFREVERWADAHAAGR